MKALVRWVSVFCVVVGCAGFRQAPAQVQHVSLAPRTSLFRYRRAVDVPVPAPGSMAAARACATLDASVYAHAELSLSDLRLFAASPIGPQERPYALTSSQTLPDADTARVLNLGLEGDRLSFDLEMPQRPYSEVDLQLDQKDFVATATVSGRHTLQPGERPVALGSFTLFDLTSQRLGRSTMLPLTESTFAYLHIDLALSGADGRPLKADPQMAQGAFIPPSREAQTLYTTVAETTTIIQRGRQSVATFKLPARVPVEQIEFVLAPGDKTNFSRAVTLRTLTQAAAGGAAVAVDPSTVPNVESLTGQISRVHLTEAGREVRLDDLHVPATIGANVNEAVTVEVAVENGDDQPIPLVAVRLKMRQRRVCFDVPQGAVTMFYGAERLDAPEYDFSRLFNPAEAVREATLGPEMANATYKAPPAVVKPFTERHPEVLWLALLVTIVTLGAVAFRSAKQI